MPQMYIIAGCNGADFAFETTLATRSYCKIIRDARTKSYEVTVLFFWLASPKIARERVEMRVKGGGHDIPEETIERRYYRGIENLFGLYTPLCDNILIVNNMKVEPEVIARTKGNHEFLVFNSEIWSIILGQSNRNE